LLGVAQPVHELLQQVEQLVQKKKNMGAQLVPEIFNIDHLRTNIFSKDGLT
jgi:hypothetical protein